MKIVVYRNIDNSLTLKTIAHGYRIERTYTDYRNIETAKERFRNAVKNELESKQ